VHECVVARVACGRNGKADAIIGKIIAGGLAAGRVNGLAEQEVERIGGGGCGRYNGRRDDIGRVRFYFDVVKEVLLEKAGGALFYQQAKIRGVPVYAVRGCPLAGIIACGACIAVQGPLLPGVPGHFYFQDIIAGIENAVKAVD
jgi:hypothetical protein